MGLNFHEDLKRDEAVRGSSDRNFGLVFAAFFTLLGLMPLRTGGHVRLPLTAVAAAFLIVALARPSILHQLNRAWLGLGLLMGRVVNPIVTALMYFLIFTPAGFILRAMGKDPLHLKLEPDADSYWIIRTPPGPKPESMSKQF